MIELYDFYANNSELKVSDIIRNLRSYVNENVKVVRFDTNDKYVNIDTGMGVGFADDNGEYASGEVIEIKPIIWGKNEKGGPIDLSESIVMGDYEKYLAHPDYYRIQLLVKGVNYSSTTVVPLKYEYAIAFVDDDAIFSGQQMQEYEL